MRFLVDEQLPPALAAWLIAKGHLAEHISDVDLVGRSDNAVWDHARRFGAVIVTKDEDFAVMQADRGGAPVLWIRIGNTVNRVLLAQLEPVWPDVLRRLEAGERLVEVAPQPPVPP